MNDIPQTNSQEVLGNIKPLTKVEVQSNFPDCIVQRSNPHSGTLTILTISDGINKRVYLEVSEDQYLPITKSGEDVSDLISAVWADTAIEFMNGGSIEIDPKTAALKVIDNKLVGPTYTGPYVQVYNMDGDYLERMILKDDILSRAKLNGEEVILHDAGHGGAPNTIQFVGNENSTDFSGELALDEDDNIILNNGKILSRQEGLSQEWEIKGKNIVLVGTKCVSPEGEVLPITLLGEDISSKVTTNQYGNETTLTFTKISKTQKVVINNSNGEVVTYKGDIVTTTFGHTAQGDTNLGICCNLKGEEVGVVLFDQKTFEVKPITLAGKDVSIELSFKWNEGTNVEYKGQEYTLDFDTGVLYGRATEVVNDNGDVSKISFLGGDLPKGAKIIGVGLLQVDPKNDKFIVKFNTQTGEVEYKKDSSGKIFLELMSKYRSGSVEDTVFYDPKKGVKVTIYDRDLLEEIDKLPYANTQAVIDDSVKATKDTLSNTDRV